MRLKAFAEINYWSEKFLAKCNLQLSLTMTPWAAEQQNRLFLFIVEVT
jgi:hypothetical protein